MQKKYNQSGFTLVELAIVMIIIGLLIGGVLKGQELVNNARVTATIKLIESVGAASMGFKDRYGLMPGDVAATKVPGCGVGNTNNCVGGDENGSVGGVLGVDDVAWTSFLGTAGMRMETTQFWKHLSLTNFMGGVDPTSDPTAPEWGKTHPSTPMGGGAEFFYDAVTTIGFSGHILRLSLDGIFGEASGNLTPSQAFSIDRKMDDGNPDIGTIVADYGDISNSCKDAQVYRENNPDGRCMLFVQMFK